MSDCFDHMCEALDGRWDDVYREDRSHYTYAPRIPICKYCRKEISFMGNVPWDIRKNRRHECDFSALLNASD